jgi:hypothetical protein
VKGGAKTVFGPTGEIQVEQTAKMPKTISVPEAGKIYYGLSKNGSYEAARRGDIETIRIGKLLRVSVAVMERKVAG